jgi:hypothetical protein
MEILDRPVADVPTPKAVEPMRLLGPPGFQWAIAEMSMEDNGLTIATAIQAGHAIAVSDGSFKDSQGTAAFVIEGADSSGRESGSTLFQEKKVARAPIGANWEA